MSALPTRRLFLYTGSGLLFAQRSELTVRQAIERIHATILHQLGLDHTKMEIPVFGRTFHLVEEGDGPITQILS